MTISKYNKDRHRVKKIFKKLDGSIALVELKNVVDISEDVITACISNYDFVGKKCIIAGFGATSKSS